MGLSVLLVVVVVEVVFAVLRIVTGSHQRRARILVRIATLGGVMLLLVAGTIGWGPRYYALVGLLAVLTLHAAVSWLRRANGSRRFVGWRVALGATGTVLLLLIAALPVAVFPEYEPLETTGPYRVATVADTFADTSRTEAYSATDEPRRLNVQLWYPEAGERSGHPLVVFSHGGTGIRSSNASLFDELASHGYVVVSIDHPYHSLYTTDVDGRTTWLDRAYWRELNEEDPRDDPRGSYDYYRKWLGIRIADIGFVIDLLLTDAASGRAPPVHELVDGDRIGVIGHSLGGSAALGIARERDDVAAVVALESPLLWDIEGVEDGEFVWTDEDYPTPALNIYSDSAWDHLADWPQYQANHALLTATDQPVSNVHIGGVGHFSLTDLALASPLLTCLLDGQRPTADARHVLRTINRLTLEFLEEHLGEI